jgi:hypothetical protein
MQLAISTPNPPAAPRHDRAHAYTPTVPMRRIAALVNSSDVYRNNITRAICELRQELVPHDVARARKRLDSLESAVAMLHMLVLELALCETTLIAWRT